MQTVQLMKLLHCKIIISLKPRTLLLYIDLIFFRCHKHCTYTQNIKGSKEIFDMYSVCFYYLKIIMKTSIIIKLHTYINYTNSSIFSF